MTSNTASSAIQDGQNDTSNLPRTDRRKLTGRAFYESIGSPKMILAPMVDQSEFAWRLLTRSYMNPESSKPLLAYTPMLHSRIFTETVKYRDHSFQPLRSGLATAPPANSDILPSDIYLDGHPAIDRPLVVQFCANDPDILLEAARYVESFCDAVDLNLGCPQGIARKGQYGAFLQDDWGRVYKLINTLHLKLGVPVTAKIRILETKERTLEYARTILSAGASILTVHGRHRDQKGHKTGLADWSVIRYLRENLPPDTVLFANGNVLRHADIQRCLDATGADGVMSAEGNLHDPTIFAMPPPPGSGGGEYWRGRDGKGGYRMDAVFRRYMDIIYKQVLERPPPVRPPLYLASHPATPPTIEQKSSDEASGQPPAKRQKLDAGGKCTSPNISAMQAHLFNLLRPLVAAHTEVRDALAKSRSGDIAAFERVLTLTEAAVKEGLQDYEAHPEKYEYTNDADVASDPPRANPDGKLDPPIAPTVPDNESSAAAVAACKRPWWVCQPYVRPLPKEAMAKGSITLSKQEKKKLQRERESAVAKTEEAPNGGATGDASSKRENDGAEGRPTQRDCQPAWRKVGATNG